MKHITSIAVFIYLFGVFSNLIGQSFPRAFEIPFIVENVELAHPMVGGLNAPQLSAVDLNNDEVLDLLVFDRVGNVMRTFLNLGIQGVSSYVYAPEYQDYFPPIINWVLMRDFNQDGIEDLFGFSDVPGVSGMLVFKGYYENDTLKFDRFNVDRPFNVLHFPIPGGGGIQSAIFISNVDYPAVQDIDGDGDLDILTFNLAGGNLEFYSNMVVEYDLGLDTLVYEIVDNCWGGIFEAGLSNAVTLSESQGQCANNFVGDIEFRHSGSTVLAFDPDFDGDQDVMLGDITFNQVNFLTNGGDNNNAWLNQQDPKFPFNDRSIDIPIFPAVFYLDINNDGQKDLIAAPNATIGIEDQESLWLYEMEDGQGFSFRKDNFLIDQMIDLGTGTHPVFVDANVDGLMDLVVANEGRFETVGNNVSSLTLFQNTGSKENPTFELVDTDFLRLQRFNDLFLGYSPTFGDMDADGDLDLLMGNDGGQLLYGENIAGPDAPIEIAFPTLSYMRIDVGGASAPEIADVNNDGLPDILVGERNGNVNFFQNIGTTTDPMFDSIPTNDFWGNIDARIPGFFNGNSQPKVLRQNGDDFVVVGTDAGPIELYAINNTSNNFTVISTQLGNIKSGERTSIDFSDIDGDGMFELAVGNKRGGIEIFETEFLVPDEISSIENELGVHYIQIAPNPTHDLVNIRISSNQSFIEDFQVSIHSLNGKLMGHFSLVEGNSRSIDLSGFTSGVYLVSIKNAKGSITRKLVVQ